MLSDGNYYLHLNRLKVRDYEDKYEDFCKDINKKSIALTFFMLILLFFIDYEIISVIITSLFYLNMGISLYFYLLNLKNRISYRNSLGFKEEKFNIKIRKKNFYFSDEFNEITIPDIHIYYIKYRKTIFQNLKFTIITGDKRYFFYISSRENKQEYERFYTELKSKKIEKEKFWKEEAVGASIILLMYAFYKII